LKQTQHDAAEPLGFLRCSGTSRKTRIETFNVIVINKILLTVAVELPEKQGLKLMMIQKYKKDQLIKVKSL